MTEETVDHGRGWRNALRLFIEQDKTYGDVLTHEWLYDAFEITFPRDDMASGEADKLRLKALTERKRLQSELLEEFQMDLQSEPKAGGYIIVRPGDQTRRAMQDLNHELKRALRDAAGRLGNVDHALLTAREQQENADAIARLSKLRGMVRKEFPRLPPSSEE